jgi:hypothetical protein
VWKLGGEGTKEATVGWLISELWRDPWGRVGRHLAGIVSDWLRHRFIGGLGVAPVLASQLDWRPCSLTWHPGSPLLDNSR